MIMRYFTVLLLIGLTLPVDGRKRIQLLKRVTRKTSECRKFDLPENGEYIDACDKAYRGVRCKEGYSMTLNTTCIGRKRRTTQTCNDIDECQDSPCKNGGTCSNSLGSFTCQCAPGYTGETCTIDIDDCSSNPCGDSGVCVDGVNNFTCICVNGYEGENCTECQYSIVFNARVNNGPMSIGILRNISSLEACEAQCNTTSGCTFPRFRDVCSLYRAPFIEFVETDFETCKNLCSADTNCKIFRQEFSECYLYSATSENLTIASDLGERLATKLCT